MQLPKSPAWLAKLIAIGCAAALLVALVFFGTSLYNCTRYKRVYQNPVYAQAEVTHHSVYRDSEGDTYYSHIRYTVNGKDYVIERYETTSSERRLTPVGTIVTVEINPENHGELIRKIVKPYATVAYGVTVCCLSGLLLRWWRLRKATAALSHAVDRETAKSDLILYIRARCFRPVFGFLAVTTVALCCAFPMLFGWIYCLIAAACTVCWLIFLRSTVIDHRHAVNDEFDVRRDVLTKKTHESDSESDTYKLFYSSGDTEWIRVVSSSAYYAAKEGAAVYSVCLPNRQKPILHYNESGDSLAC